MSLIAHILVPVTFSPACGWAARYAAGLAAHVDADLTFITVSDSAKKDDLESFLDKHANHAPRRRLVILSGDPADRIVDYAVHHRADLIIMPTHSYGRFRRFLLGSVTAKVLHDAECPVLTGVHHQDAAFPVPEQFRNIVCAIDREPSCLSVAGWASEFNRVLNARLRFVHAIPAVDETSDNCGEIEVQKYWFNRASQEFGRYFEGQRIKPEVQLRGGEVAKVIREAALADGADLVIVGRGHTDRTLGRLRTHTYSIIRNSPCPVVSV